MSYADRKRIQRRTTSDRDGGRFLALPHVVLESPGFRGLSHAARSLLLDVASQLDRGNNGRLLTSRARLGLLGWKSSDTLTRCRQELIRAGLLFETVKGSRPNRAAWHAVTWMALDPHPGYDPGAAAAFERGAYLRKIEALTPPIGQGSASIAPPIGQGGDCAAPAIGPMEACFWGSSRPIGGHHLDIPSPPAGSGRSGDGGGIAGRPPKTAGGPLKAHGPGQAKRHAPADARTPAGETGATDTLAESAALTSGKAVLL